MRLKRESLTAWRISFQPKSLAINEIADELGLGLDSFVFIDDNPAEIAEVQANHPEVSCILMPRDPVGWLSAIQNAGVLDRLPPTAEDLERPTRYEEERLRREERSRASSPEEYLKQLGITVSMFAPAPGDMARLAQLINKTNQFNLNCRRRTEAELLALCADKRHAVRLVHATDRFGDYGVIGSFVLKVDGSKAAVDTFLLSCRAMGRGIELAMLASIFEEAKNSGANEVLATLEECPRNEPARTFFSKLGCETWSEPGKLRRVEWPTYVARRSEGH